MFLLRTSVIWKSGWMGGSPIGRDGYKHKAELTRKQPKGWCYKKPRHIFLGTYPTYNDFWKNFCLREGWLYKIGWFFGKVPNGPWPSPYHFRKIILQFVFNGYGRIYARRYEGQIVWNACRWFPEIWTILRGGGWGSIAVWNLSENPSDLVAWPIRKVSQRGTSSIYLDFMPSEMEVSPNTWFDHFKVG